MKIGTIMAPLVARVYGNMLSTCQIAENVSMRTLFVIAWLVVWSLVLAALLWFSREYDKAARGALRWFIM